MNTRQKYYINNREKILKYQKLYYKNNKGKIREYNRQYYLKNINDSLLHDFYGTSEEFGKIIVFEKQEYRFLQPPGEWNGDYYIDYIPTYFLKKL